MSDSLPFHEESLSSHEVILFPSPRDHSSLFSFLLFSFRMHTPDSMSQHHETNPHFSQQQLPPPQPQHQNQQPRPQHHNQPPQPQHRNQPPRPQHQNQPPQPQILRVPPPRQTNPIIWFTAVFCAIFWVIIIVGGLIVLIVYLVFRPRSPRFDVSSATLNAAYLDMGYLLNADLTVLANFTNPNKKVSVDFSYMVIDLYYGNTLLATRSIYPFSATRMESKFASVHMITSQVQLPLKDSKRLTRQMERNRVTFEVKGLFRTRSNLGGFLRYSYWLYGHCSIVVTGPPSGVLVASKCRTKR